MLDSYTIGMGFVLDVVWVVLALGGSSGWAHSYVNVVSVRIEEFGGPFDT